MRASTASWSCFLGVVAFSAFAGGSCAKGATIYGVAGGGGSGATIGAGGTGGSGEMEGGVAESGTDAPSDGPIACLHQSDCAALDDACNVGSCVNNVCTPEPANEGTSCPTGLFCMVNGFCTGGACVGSPMTCPGTDACNVGSCDEATQTCNTMQGNDGDPCLPTNDVCFSAGICSAGTCAGTEATDCSYLDDTCNTGSCDPVMGCTATPFPNGTPCPGTSVCFASGVCSNGTCNGAPTVCPPSTTACQVNTCVDPIGCTLEIAPDGTACATASLCLAGQTCTGGACGGGTPANEGMSCPNTSACTQGSKCTAGACTGTAITACVSGDGCCPTGCTAENDSDCNCNVNLALTATPSLSSGGTISPYTVVELNNGIGESQCNRDTWINNSSAQDGAYWELDWPSAVTVASLYIEAPTSDGISGPCSEESGRNVASADVQTWDGTTWVTQTSFTGQSGNIQVDLPTAVSTTKLRLYNVTAVGLNSIIFELHVFASPGCIPPAD
jgi:hypothetical protein